MEKKNEGIRDRELRVVAFGIGKSEEASLLRSCVKTEEGGEVVKVLIPEENSPGRKNTVIFSKYLKTRSLWDEEI